MNQLIKVTIQSNDVTLINILRVYCMPRNVPDSLADVSQAYDRPSLQRPLSVCKGTRQSLDWLCDVLGGKPCSCFSSCLLLILSSLYVAPVSSFSEFLPTLLIALGLASAPPFPLTASPPPSCWLRVLPEALVWQSTLIQLFSTLAVVDLLPPFKTGNSRDK